MNTLQKLNQSGTNVQINVPLSPYTYIKIGGPADFLAVVSDQKQFINLLKIAFLINIPVTILGGGSNILISDSGIRGLVIINHTSRIKIINQEPPQLQVSSGTPMNQLVNYCLDKGFGNLEEFLGIPGTIGGAIVNNSHHLQHLIGDYIESVNIITQKGEKITLNSKQCQFGYDKSVFQSTNDIIISAVFNLTIKDSSILRQKSQIALIRRRNTQPLDYPSSGCMFKNIDSHQLKKLSLPQPITAAGYLIDQAGLKGLKVGGAEVSTKHANFIINKNNATAKDVQNLSDQIIQKIKEKYNLTLEREVFFIGD